MNLVEHRRLERMMRKILNRMCLKNVAYRMSMLPSQEIALNRIRRIVGDTTIERGDGKKIIIHSINTRNMKHAYIEGGLAKALQLRGHVPKIILCGGALNMCTAHHTIDKPYKVWHCEDCTAFSRRFCDAAKIDYATYYDYVTSFDYGTPTDIVLSDDFKDYTYKNVSVGYHTLTSANRYFKGSTPSKSAYNTILILEYINAILATNLAEHVVEVEKPDILISSHECYSAWGCFSEYFIKNNITTRFYMPGEEWATIRFDRGRLQEYFDIYKTRHTMTELENKELDIFIYKRVAGASGQVAHYNFTDVSKQKLDKLYHFSDYDRTISMFPNVPWDAALHNANVGFASPYDWIYTTIDTISKMPDTQLILKLHPSEKLFLESKKTLMESINEKYSDFPSNIKILESDTRISPYSLLSFTDIGLVYNGTIGLEMSMMNIPVIASGNAHYGNNGFTYDIMEPEEYITMLRTNIKPIPNQVQLSRQYAYFHFIKSFVPNNFIYYNSFLDMGWNIKSLSDFNPGKDRYMDHICDYIINGGVYQEW